MQNTTFLFLIVITIFSCSSATEFGIKETEVPPNVLAAFRAKYPAATNVEWQAEKDDGRFYFEADFKEGAEEKEVQITPDGASITEPE